MRNKHSSPSDTGFFRDIQGNPISIRRGTHQKPKIVRIAPAHVALVLGAHREEELYGKSPTLDLLQTGYFDPNGSSVFSGEKAILKEFLKRVAGPDARVIQKEGVYHITREVYEKIIGALREDLQIAFMH